MVFVGFALLVIIATRTGIDVCRRKLGLVPAGDDSRKIPISLTDPLEGVLSAC